MRSFKAFLAERMSSGIDDFEDTLRKKYGLAKLWLWSSENNPNVIGLQLLAVNKDEQGQGKGTKAMEELCKYADENKLTIVLSPSERNKQMGTTSKARLVDFYKRFGFVENKGKAKDFRFTATMYRTPR